MTTPVVALLGKENVGKSSMYNALTKTKDALSCKQPGFTVDKLIGYVTYNDSSFILFDTPGIPTEIDKDNLMKKNAILGTWNALDEADYILYIVAPDIGFSELDKEIIAKVRKLNKRFSIVLNKSDLKQVSNFEYQLYEQLNTDILKISAEHYRGIEDLKEFLSEKLELDKIKKIQENKKDKVFSMTLVGMPNVGKSTLANKLADNERVIVSDTPGTTRDSIKIPIKYAGLDFDLIDTAGIRKKNKCSISERLGIIKTLQAIAIADISIVIIDAYEGVTNQDLTVISKILQLGRPLILAFNKLDLLEDFNKYIASVHYKFNFIKFCKIHPISAKKGIGIKKVFQDAYQTLLRMQQDFPTSRLSKILEQAINMHKIPIVSGKQAKLRYAHLGKKNPFTIIIHGSRVTNIPKSYKRYLENYFRKSLDLTNIPINLIFKSSTNPYHEPSSK